MNKKLINFFFRISKLKYINLIIFKSHIKMKVLQVLLILCIFALLNCDGMSTLKCAVDKLGTGLTDSFISKFKSDPDSAFSYAKSNKASITKAINSCL